MARRKTELEVASDVDVLDVVCIALDGSTWLGTADADICCGGCKRIIIAGYTTETLRDALPRPMNARPGTRYPYFFECNFCGVLPRFLPPS